MPAQSLPPRRRGAGVQAAFLKLRKKKRAIQFKIDRTGHGYPSWPKNQTYGCPMCFPRAGHSGKLLRAPSTLKLSPIDENAGSCRRIQTEHREGRRQNQNAPIMETVNADSIYKSEFEGPR